MRIALPKNHIVLFFLILLVSIPITSYAVDGQRKLTQPVPPATFPIVINQAGSYVLTSNLVVTDPNLNAIEITVNDVTLDLNGHKIQGPHTGSPWGGTGNGIYANDKYNLTIRNGRIWGFGGDGVHLYSTYPSNQGAGHRIEKIQAANNGKYGIKAYSCLISSSTTNNNNEAGIDATDSTITDCVANKNLFFGILASSCTLANSTINRNRFGLQSSDCAVTNCIAVNNIDYGFSATSSTVTNCIASKNNDGFSIHSSILTNSSSLDNSGNGIVACQMNRIEGNNVQRNDAHGIYLYTIGDIIVSQYNYVIKNTASTNLGGNFQDNGIENYMPLTGDNANYGF